MQQTETYKLNLIETGDPFSPNALNENMEKVEAKLAVLDGTDEALDARVTALEVKKIVYGTYEGGSGKIELDFTPKFVILVGMGANTTLCGFIYPGVTTNRGGQIVENGFISDIYSYINSGGYTYGFVAFG